MTQDVDLYDGHYGHLTADPQVEVRRRTYDEDRMPATATIPTATAATRRPVPTSRCS